MKKFWGAIGKALLYFLLIMGTQIIALMVAGVVSGILAGAQLPENADANQAMLAGAQAATEFISSNVYWITMASSLLTIGILLLMSLARKKRFLEQASIAMFSKKWIAPLIVIGLSLNVFVSILVSFIPGTEALQKSLQESVGMITGELSVLSILVVAIIVPIVEEVVFRGFILSRLRRGMPTVAAVLIGSFFFGLAHGQLLWIVQAMIMGIVLSILTIQFDSIVPSIVVHMTINLTSVVLSNLFPTTDTSSSAESMVVTLVIFGISAVVLGGMMFLLFKKTTKTVDLDAELPTIAS